MNKRRHNSFWRAVLTCAPHISIINCLMIAVFMVIDHFNRYIGFMSHRYTVWVLAILIVCTLISDIALIAAQRKEKLRRWRREQAHRDAQRGSGRD